MKPSTVVSVSVSPAVTPSRLAIVSGMSRPCSRPATRSTCFTELVRAIIRLLNTLSSPGLRLTSIGMLTTVVTISPRWGSVRVSFSRMRARSWGEPIVWSPTPASHMHRSFIWRDCASVATLDRNSGVAAADATRTSTAPATASTTPGLEKSRKGARVHGFVVSDRSSPRTSDP